MVVAWAILTGGPGSVSDADAAVGSGAATLGAEDLKALGEARAEGRRTVTLLIAAEEGRTGAVAAGIERLGGQVEKQSAAVGYVRASLPIDQVLPAAALGAVEAVDVDRTVPLEDPRPQGDSPALPQTPPDQSTPRTNPYMPLQDTGSDTFGTVPDQDGRGVKLAILDTGVDLAHEALQTTSTGDPKVIDWVNAIPPQAGDATWLKTEGQYLGQFTAANYQWTAPNSGGPYAFALLVENRGDLAGGEVKGDLNRNGVIGEKIGVLQNRANNSVIVDVDMDRDFTDDPVLRDYRFDHDRGFLGVDDPGTPIEERMAFTVDTRRSTYQAGSDAGTWVNIGISGNSHGSHVAGIAAGHELFGGTMAGAAPGAELISVKVCPTDGGCSSAAMTDGMLYAAQAGADVANMSVGGMELINDGSDATSEIYNRIADEYGMSMFISAGNDGPGTNAVSPPSVASKVISVAASVSSTTWLSNYGQSIATPLALFNFSSRGPALDGGMKPELTAPGSAVSAIPPWQAGSPIPGTYSLPPGYAMYNGTSMSSPAAAGAAAQLVGAYREQENHRPSPLALREALMSTSTPIPGSAADGQGAGLIDVPAAWEHLRENIAASAVEIEAKVPVRHVLDSRLSTPGIGRGIYDREGVSPGQGYTRTYTLTRRSGPAGPRTFDLSWSGDTDVFSSAGTVVLPLDEPVELPVRIYPALGINSAVLRIDDPATAATDLMTQNVVFGSPAESLVTEASGTVAKGGSRSVVVRVPKGTKALRINLEGGGPEPAAGRIRFRSYDPQGMPYERLASSACFIPDTGTGCPAGSPSMRTIENPVPGVWEIVVEGHLTSSAAKAPWQVTASLLSAKVAPDPDRITLRKPATVNRTYRATNTGAAFKGKLVGGNLSATRSEAETIDQAGEVTESFTPPENTELLTVKVGGAVPGAVLDVDLLECDPTCEEVWNGDPVDDEMVVRYKDPKPVEYRAVVHGTKVPGGSTDFSLTFAFRNPELGSIEVDDSKQDRPTDATWEVPATVKAEQVPGSQWKLMGELLVLEDNNKVAGRSRVDIGFDADPPKVSLTKTPPSSGSDPDATFEFTVDDPEAKASCRFDDGEWAACTSPRRYVSLPVGKHRFEVRAEDEVGFGETVGFDFRVTKAEACPAVKLGLKLQRVASSGRARIRVKAKSGKNVIATISPSLKYRAGGETHTVRLKRQTVRIDGSRQLGFPVPVSMRRNLRRSGASITGAQVTVRMEAKARLAGTDQSCTQKLRVKPLRTRAG